MSWANQPTAFKCMSTFVPTLVIWFSFVNMLMVMMLLMMMTFNVDVCIVMCLVLEGYKKKYERLLEKALPVTRNIYRPSVIPNPFFAND